MTSGKLLQIFFALLLIGGDAAVLAMRTGSRAGAVVAAASFIAVAFCIPSILGHLNREKRRSWRGYALIVFRFSQSTLVREFSGMLPIIKWTIDRESTTGFMGAQCEDEAFEALLKKVHARVSGKVELRADTSGSSVAIVVRVPSGKARRSLLAELPGTIFISDSVALIASSWLPIKTRLAIKAVQDFENPIALASTPLSSLRGLDSWVLDEITWAKIESLPTWDR